MDALRGLISTPSIELPVSRFEDLTVDSVSPLRLIRTGVDAEPLSFTPDSLIELALLSVGDRVRCEWAGTRLIITGRAGGAPEALDLQVLGGKDGAAPAGAKIIVQVGRVDSTEVAGGIASITFHTPFPNSCAAVIPVTTAGSTFSNPRINNDNVTKTGCELIWNGTVGGVITVSYVAIGW